MKRLPGVLVVLVLVFWLLASGCQKVISGTGYVYDKSTGLPLQGATVDAYLGSPTTDAGFMTTQTDAKGGYYVHSQPYKCTGTCPDLYVSISKSGYHGQYVKSPHNDTTYLVPIH